MPNRRLAFMGSQLVGPPVSIAGLAKPKLRVRGFPQGGSLQVQVDASVVLFVVEDGEHILPEGTWLQCICDRTCRTLICDVVSNKAAA